MRRALGLGLAMAVLSVAEAKSPEPSRPLGGILRWGQDIVVAAGDSVEGPVVAVNGSITIAGKVEGPVLAIGGDVRLKPGARVEGPVLSTRGHVTLESAQVEGPVVELPGLAWGRIGMALGSLLGLAGSFWVAYKILGALGSIAIAALLWILFPKALESTRQSLDARPGLCALAGVLFWPCLGVTASALLVSILGIPLLPLVALAVVGAWYWGLTALGFWLGGRLSQGLWKSPLLSVVLGTALLRILHWVPVANLLVCLAVAVAGVGAAVTSRFGTRALAQRGEP